MVRRIPIIAGNWKMNPATYDECLTLLHEIRELIHGPSSVERVICPPSVWLSDARRELAGANIAIGAQNMHWENKGSYTGEVGAAMIADICSHVILGHSERRAYFCEDDQAVNLKVKAALNGGFTPILCVGETQAERESARSTEILVKQVDSALQNVMDPRALVIAYEPVWAIGTGIAASGGVAAQAVKTIRKEIVRLFGKETAESVRVIYGGSVNASNIGEFVGYDEIDGALVGGASLKAESLSEIIHETLRIKG